MPILILGVLALVLFVRSSDLPAEPPASPVQHLEERKAAIYENLRDLNFEFRLGKLSEADYTKTKVGLQTELAKVMAEIDRILKLAPAAVAVAASAAPTQAWPNWTGCPASLPRLGQHRLGGRLWPSCFMRARPWLPIRRLSAGPIRPVA